MTEQHMMEEISKAYVKAVAASAGILAKVNGGLDYGLDGKFSDVEYYEDDTRYSENGFGIDFQIKATTNTELREGNLIYDLEVKNYKDLIKTNVGTPRILILYYMPRDREEWVNITEDEMILRKCAWWCSLKGLENTNNTATKRIEIPENQLLTSEELRRLINCVKEGVDFNE